MVTASGKTFVPQIYDWGEESQVDWYEAFVDVTTNLPFSEWQQVFTNARLCKAVLDRLTDQAHIIETGSESYRFRRKPSKKQKHSAATHEETV